MLTKPRRAAPRVPLEIAGWDRRAHVGGPPTASDPPRGENTAREGKGDKDRVTTMPRAIAHPLLEHLEQVKSIHQRDVAGGYGRVELPNALVRKYPNANREWVWQFVFPQEHRWNNAKTGDQGRYHVHESLVQKAIKQAVRQAGLTKRVTSHTFHHSFATHLLTDGYDIRTVQELLGHKDVRTTMPVHWERGTHVLNRGGRGVRSPADGLRHRPRRALDRGGLSCKIRGAIETSH